VNKEIVESSVLVDILLINIDAALDEGVGDLLIGDEHAGFCVVA
jgi:hypothetical protein